MKLFTKHLIASGGRIAAGSFTMALFFSTWTSILAEIPLTSGMGQLGAELKWSQITAGQAEVYRLQPTVDGSLYLTANESFFPRLGLLADGQGEVPDVEKFNGGKSYKWIGKWDVGDVAQWSWWSEKRGVVHIRVWMSSSNDQSRFVLRAGSESFNFSTKSSGEESVMVAEVDLSINETAKQGVELECVAGGDTAKLLCIELTGDAVQGASVIRKRWRPAAAHTKFTSSTVSRPVRLWVMEMDAVPGTLGFYSPITTPFGYYGPTWKSDGRVNTGFNFSLWSYGRGKEEPPIEQLSHLLAIGNRNATFGGFGHEGTGVKVRDWEPLSGYQGQRQAFALRVEPGEMYNTYFSYFYLASQNRWELFAVGNQFNKGNPLESLWVGSFVEVPGPPHVQRTGPYARAMRYRGWVMDDQDSWHALDLMSNSNVDRETGLTHTNRGVTSDGWFFLETGAWGYRHPAKESVIANPKMPSMSDQPYLEPQVLASLRSVPSAIRLQRLNRVGDDLQIEYLVEDGLSRPTVTLYWGDREGLTLKDRWKHSLELESPVKERNQVTLNQLLAGEGTAGQLYFRLLLQNEKGQFWSESTRRLINSR